MSSKDHLSKDPCFQHPDAPTLKIRKLSKTKKSQRSTSSAFSHPSLPVKQGEQRMMMQEKAEINSKMSHKTVDPKYQDIGKLRSDDRKVMSTYKDGAKPVVSEKGALKRDDWKKVSQQRFNKKFFRSTSGRGSNFN